MKWLKKISGFLLSLGLILCQLTPAMAAEMEYTYTVRFFSGAQGTFKGAEKEMVVHEKLQPGQRVTFNQRDVELNDNSKYYIKGIRESGKDNNQVGKDGAVEQTRTSFEVEEDQDYVVVYGLLTDAVSYTVSYVDTDGNELAPSETYYGNVGDAPVIAYLYIEGYQPQAYNLTGVLQRDASKNVFNFVYSPIGQEQEPEPAGPGATQAPAAPAGTTAPAAPTTAPGVQATIAPPANPAPGTTTTTTTTGGQQAGDNADAGEAAEGEEGGDDAEAAEGEAEAEAEEGNEPAELEQIGDEEVPLADMGNETSGLEGMSNDFAKRVGELPFAAKVGVISAVLLGLGAAAWFLLIRDKKKQEEKVE